MYKLEPLSDKKSLELLWCGKAFFSGFGGCCTKEYEDVGLEMVRKCERLPLAIVALVVFYIANVKVHLNGQV